MVRVETVDLSPGVCWPWPVGTGYDDRVQYWGTYEGHLCDALALGPWSSWAGGHTPGRCCALEGARCTVEAPDPPWWLGLICWRFETVLRTCSRG